MEKLIKRVQKITESRISEEQGGFGRGRGCVDQIFSLRMTGEKNDNKREESLCSFY